MPYASRLDDPRYDIEKERELALRRQAAEMVAAQMKAAGMEKIEKDESTKKQNPQAQWIKGFKNVALDGFMAALILPFPWVHAKYLMRQVRTAIDPAEAMGGVGGQLGVGARASLGITRLLPFSLGSSALEPLSPPEKAFAMVLNAFAFWVYAGMLVALIMMAVAYYVCEEKLFGLLSADTCLSIVGTFASP